MFSIRSITATIHDTGFGGYPFKVIVMVDIPTKDFNKLCSVVSKRPATIFRSSRAVRDLGNLVMEVNSVVYKMNSNISAYNPSIDSEGSKKAKNGIKTLEFVYFSKNLDSAEKLGFEFHNFKNSEKSIKAFQTIELA